MSMSSQILELYDGRRSVREIATIVGCHNSYVRVVARQRKGAGKSIHDIKYEKSEAGQIVRKRVIIASRARHRALARTGDKAAAKTAWQNTYRAAKLVGKPYKEAHRLANTARLRSLRKTGSAVAATKAFKKAYREAAPC